MRLRILGALVALALCLASGVASAASPPVNDEGYDADGLGLIQVPEAWTVTTGSPTIIIAVVDSGIDPIDDLASNLLPGYNAVDGSTNTKDVNGHGTQAASPAAAVTDNKVGVAGVCQRCRLLPIRVETLGNDAQPKAVAAGIDWAVAHGARVINISQKLQSNTGVNDAISRAQAQGVVVVIGAGNNGTADASGNPLAFDNPNAIRVAGSMRTLAGGLDSSSNHGSKLADIAAPYKVMVDKRDGSYGFLEGTSYSTALVSGAVGLLLSKEPGLSPADVKKRLMDTGTKGDFDVGCGCVLAAGKAVGYKPPSPPPVKPKVKLTAKVLGKGKVTSRPAGIACGFGSRVCARLFVSGTKVTLAARPAAGQRFVRWTGACHGTKPSCAMTLSKSVLATAVFGKR